MMWRHKLYAMVSSVGSRRLVALFNQLAERTGGSTAGNISQVFSISMCEWGPDFKETLVGQLWDMCDMPPESDYLHQHRPYLGVAELDQLLSRGHEVGLHTKSHPLCSQLDNDGVIREIVRPAKMLRETLGLSYLPFAYPFGERLDQDREKELFDSGVFNCALGVTGMSFKGCPAYRLNRSDCELGSEFSVFGRHMLSSMLPFLEKGV